MGERLIQRLFRSAVTVYFILCPVSPLSIDICTTIRRNDDYPGPLVCNQHDELQSCLLLLPGNDLFVAGKSVESLNGDIVLLLSSSPCGLRYTYDHNITQDWSFTCSEVFLEHEHLHLHNAFNLTQSTRQSVYDSLSLQNEYLDKITQTITFLVSREGWKTSVIFTSSYEELSALSSSVQSPACKCLLFTLDELTSVNETMERIYALLEKENLNFIILCSGKCIVKFLQQAKQLEIQTKKTSRWLVVPTDGFSRDVIDDRIPLPTSDIAILDILPCSKQQNLLNIATLKRLLSTRSNTNGSLDHGEVMDYIEKTLSRNKSMVNAKVLTLHTPPRGSVLRNIGRIYENGHMAIPEDLFPGAKYGLNGKKLIVSTLEWPPFVIKQEKNGSFTYTGLCMNLLHELSLSLNFTYKIVEPEDEEWGRVLNGTWTGLIGQLTYKNVDLVVAPITITEAREKVLDFTVPFYYVHSAIILKKPDPDTKKWMILVAPFQAEVHVCILVSLILSAAFLFTVENLNSLNQLADSGQSVRWTRYFYVLWYHFGILIKNDAAIPVPTTFSGRNILMCWSIFAVISAAIYSGNLIAFLTDRREKPPFSNLAEMVEQDTYKWGITGGSAYVSLFQESNVTVYKKIWQGLQRDPYMVTMNTDIHKRKTLAGQYAYLGEVTLTELWMRENCDLEILHDNFFLMKYGVALQNNSIYTSLFSNQVLRIYEMGLPHLWYKRWSLPVSCASSKAVKKIDLPALQSAFYMVAVGVFMAVFVFIIEVLYQWKYRKHI